MSPWWWRSLIWLLSLGRAGAPMWRLAREPGPGYRGPAEVKQPTDAQIPRYPPKPPRWTDPGRDTRVG